VVAGKKRGRTGPEEITLFKSVGWAPEDAATARLAYDRARTRGMGMGVSL
jgi:ornithine cyclodeaminase/alanine dehydrogenase